MCASTTCRRAHHQAVVVRRDCGPISSHQSRSEDSRTRRFATRQFALRFAMRTRSRSAAIGTAVAACGSLDLAPGLHSVREVAAPENPCGSLETSVNARRSMETTVKTRLGATLALLLCGFAQAQAPAILVDACNQMQPASKRPECLRAAEGRGAASAVGGGGVAGSPTRSLAAYSAPPSTSSRAPRSTGGQTCYTGPRGGTYTITASGRKNYNGC